MARLFPINVPLTIVWHFNKPDNTDFDITGYEPRLYYRSGNRETEVSSTVITKSGNTLSFTFPTTWPRFEGEYHLKLQLFQNNALWETFNYRQAWAFARTAIPGSQEATQQNAGQTVHLFTCAEYYLFQPIIPTVDSDGYWVVNGTRVTDGSGNPVPSSHTVTYDAETNQIIIDQGRVDKNGNSIAQTITALDDALDNQQELYEAAEGTQSGSVSGDGSRWGSYKAAEAARNAARTTAEGTKNGSTAGDGSMWGEYKAAEAARNTGRAASEGTKNGSTAGDGSMWGEFKANENGRDNASEAQEGTKAGSTASDGTRWGEYKNAEQERNAARAAAEGTAARSIAGDGSMWGTFKSNEQDRNTALANAEGSSASSTAGDGSRWGSYKAAEDARDADAEAAEGTVSSNAGDGSRWGAYKTAEANRNTAYTGAEAARNTARATAEGSSSSTAGDGSRWGAYKTAEAARELVSAAAAARANNAAAAAEHMVDIHEGPQGPQGNTGSSVDYPYELVNNLTTDDATKGLSAAQGKTLDGKISQLGQKWGFPDKKIEGFYTGYISTNGNFTNTVQSSATIRSRNYDVTPGQKYKIYGKAANNNYYRIYAIFAADGTRIERDTTSGDYTVNPKEVTIPSNGVHMTVNLSDYNDITDGVYLDIGSTDASTLQKEIDAMDEKLIEKTAMEAIVTAGWVLTGNNNGNSGTDASGRIRSFPVTAGELLYLKLSADFPGVYQWQSETGVPSSGTNTKLIGHSINWAVDGYFEVPTGATWLIVSELKTNTTNEVKKVTTSSLNDYVRKNDIGTVLWGSVVDRNKHKESALVSVLARGGTEAIKAANKLSLLHCSDIHGNSANLANIVKFRDYYAQYLDDAIHTGDSVVTYIQDANPFETVEGAGNILNVIGNHDAWVSTSDTDYNATEKQTYDKIFAPSIANWDVTQPENAASNGYCYYYKDYSTAGFRLIVLDSIHWHYRNSVSQENAAQKTWFESVLADAITQNLRVICATHYTPQNGIVPVPNTGFNVLGTTEGAAIADGWYAVDEIFGCVDTFIGNGGKFAGWIMGHTHEDYFGTVRNHTSQPLVVIGCSKGSGSVNNKFITGTVSQDNFNVITFETIDSKNIIKVVKIGQDTDIYLRSKKTICYNFTDGVLISTT